MAYYTVKSTEEGANAKNARIITLDMHSARQAMHAYNNCILIDDNGNEIDRKKTAFKFSELDDKAKDRARNWYCEGIELWTETYTDFLTICGFAEPKLYFSICYSQSDFAAFESRFFDYEKGFVAKVAAEFGKDSEFHKLAIQLRGIYARSFYKMCGKVKTGSRDRAYCDIHHEFDAFEDNLNEWINDACEEIRVQLYRDYEYQCSDESVIESCDANGYLFNKFGGVI